MEISEYQNLNRNESSHWWYTGLHDLISRFVSTKKKESSLILDAGCGTGGLLRYLKNKFPSLRAFGIDYSRIALDFCKDRYISVAQASVSKLPFEAKTFDLIVSLDVLYHRAVIDDLLALGEFHRVLKRDGVLILHLPAFDILKNNHDAVVHTKRRYNKSSLTRKLLVAGFTIDHMSYRNTFLFPVLLILKWYQLLFERQPETSLKSNSRLINYIFRGVLKIETWLILRGLSLPIGSSVVCIAVKRENINF